MNLIFYFIILIIFQSVLLSEKDFKVEDNILILTDEDFQKALGTYEILFVLFHSDSCSHCIKTFPEFAKVAKYFRSSDNLKLVKMKSNDAGHLLKYYKVFRYPTLLLFQNETLADEYRGEKNATTMISYLESMYNLMNYPITNFSVIENLRDNKFFSMIYFGKNQSDMNILKNMFIHGNKHLIRCVSNDKEVMQKMEVSDRTVVLLKKFDQKRVDYSFAKDDDRKHFQKFFNEYSVIYVHPMSYFIYLEIFWKNKTGIIMFYDEDDKNSKEIESIYFNSSKLFRQILDKDDMKGWIKSSLIITSLYFTKVNINPKNDRIENDVVNLVKIKKSSKFPQIRIIDNKNEKNVPFEGEFTAQNIYEFLINYFFEDDSQKANDPQPNNPKVDL